MMRMLVTGKTGQLACSLVERAKGFPHISVITLGRPELDLEDPAGTEARILAEKPDIVVNAAAYTAVDKAESEPDRAFAVNRDGAAAVARAAARLNVPLVHISTDYVFDGTKGEPYVETDTPNPINVYGASKLAGEQAVMAAHPAPVILRTSWMFSPYGNNFVKTILRLAKERDVIRVVDDQFGTPTSALDLADAILTIVPTLSTAPGSGGLYHFCNEGRTSWCGFARFILAESARLGGPTAKVEAITTAEYPTAARRPATSELCTSAFEHQHKISPAGWQAALGGALRYLVS